jgi:hypothetical protein
VLVWRCTTQRHIDITISNTDKPRKRPPATYQQALKQGIVPGLTHTWTAHLDENSGVFSMMPDVVARDPPLLARASRI